MTRTNAQRLATMRDARSRMLYAVVPSIYTPEETRRRQAIRRRLEDRAEARWLKEVCGD